MVYFTAILHTANLIKYSLLDPTETTDPMSAESKICVFVWNKICFLTVQAYPVNRQMDIDFILCLRVTKFDWTKSSEN